MNAYRPLAQTGPERVLGSASAGLCGAVVLLALAAGCQDSAGIHDARDKGLDSIPEDSVPAPVPSDVELTPQSATAEVGDTVQFAAAVFAEDGSEIDAPVAFTAKGGTISEQGLYVAGDAPGVFTVIAKLVGGDLADSAMVTLTMAEGRSYTTAFSVDEDPISEGGQWVGGGSVGLDWTDVATGNGRATGKQTGASYTDATAILAGSWAADQMVTATVYTGTPPAENCYPEVEMRLRSSISAHDNRGYEVAFKVSRSSSAYLIIVRWNGRLGDFTYLTRLDGAQYGVRDGDIVSARIEGDKIVAFKNGVAMGHAVDDTYAAGSPGMGFNLENAPAGCSGTNQGYGFSHLTATELR